MFCKDVKSGLLNEFVVSLFAYNLLYKNKRYFVGTGVCPPQKMVVCSRFRNACFRLLMDSEWKPGLLFFFICFLLLKFLNWMCLPEQASWLWSGRSRSTSLLRRDCRMGLCDTDNGVVRGPPEADWRLLHSLKWDTSGAGKGSCGSGRLSPTVVGKHCSPGRKAVNVFTVLFSVPRDCWGGRGRGDSENAAVRVMFHLDVNVNVQLKWLSFL